MKGHDREGLNRYMRDYMREYRRKQRASRAGQDRAPAGGGRGPGEHSYAEVTAKALYIPDRYSPLEWESPAAEFLGDPPIGRRAIDTR